MTEENKTSSNKGLVQASSYWVWTEKAEESNLNPKRTKANEPVWPHYLKEAPAKWLKEGLIKDSSEVVKKGQADLFEYLF